MSENINLRTIAIETAEVTLCSDASGIIAETAYMTVI